MPWAARLLGELYDWSPGCDSMEKGLGPEKSPPPQLLLASSLCTAPLIAGLTRVLHQTLRLQYLEECLL